MLHTDEYNSLDTALQAIEEFMCKIAHDFKELLQKVEAMEAKSDSV